MSERIVASGIGALLALESRAGAVIAVADGVPLEAPVPGARDDVRAASLHAGGPPAQALELAAAMAAAGRRVALFLPPGASASCLDGLRRQVERLVPLVAYAAVIGGEEIDDLARSGAAVAVARDAAHAMDLALVARRMAERALVPVVIVLEAAEVAWSACDVTLPEPARIRAAVGAPGDELDAPDAGQRLLFGSSRRRVPRRIDPDRPVALGLELPDAERAASSAGRRALFEERLAETLDHVLGSAAAPCGSDLAPLIRHRPRRPQGVLVAEGAAVGLAAAAAGRLRDRERLRIEVLGLTWRHPLARSEIRSALEGARRVAVLQRASSPGGSLAHALDGLLPPSAVRSEVDYHRPLSAPGAERACRSLLADPPRATVDLDVAAPSVLSSFPRRQALMQRLRRDLPELDAIAGAPDGIAAPVPGARTLIVDLESDAPPVARLAGLASRLSETLGAHVRSRLLRPAPGAWRLQLTFSAGPIPDPGAGAAADVAVLESIRLAGAVAAPAIAPGGALVAAGSAGSEDGAALPRSWRDAPGERGRALRVSGPAAGDAATPDWLVPVEGLLRDGRVEGLEPLAPEPAPAEEGDVAPPLAVRRLGSADAALHNVARFWGELGQPRRHEVPGAAVPEPYLLSSTVPACTAGLLAPPRERSRFPVIDPERCSGCGLCWASCPDAAIGAAAVPTAALLDSAAGRAEATLDEPARAASARLRRAHRQLAARLHGLLSERDAAALTPSLLRETIDGLLEKLRPDDEGEREALARAGAALAQELEPLPLAVTGPLFGEREAEKRGAGELLLLAVDAGACQGCGVCEAVCPDGAIAPATDEAAAVARAVTVRQAWEALPDTAGATIVRAADHDAVGPLPAALLSRHVAFTVFGAGAEPGSGARIALRQVAAAVEYEMQHRARAWLERLDGLEQRLRGAIHDEIAQVGSVDDLARLERALEGPAPLRLSGGELLSRLDELGEPTEVDAPRVRRLVALARRLERLREELRCGPLGIGRARFALVLAGGADRLLGVRFPVNPFAVPVLAAPGDGSAAARGLAETLRAAARRELDLEREAERLLEGRADEGDAPGESDAEHDAAAPRVLLVLGPEADPAAALAGLLEHAAPVTVVALDELDLRGAAHDPVLAALALQQAFVLSTSIAHPRHLFEGVRGALGHPGPSLIRVHAPSPARHGFDPARTLDRARDAVTARVNPLVRYAPAAGRPFALCLDLAGNPDPEAAESGPASDGPLTPEAWAAGERRFDPVDLPSVSRGVFQPTVPGPNGGRLAHGGSLNRALERCGERWSALRELAGLATPSTERLRERLERELRDGHAAELDALRGGYEQRMAALEGRQAEVWRERLRRRLLELAGYGARRPS